jgi:hypothetical protein
MAVFFPVSQEALSPGHVRAEGTWRLKDDQIVFTTTTSNSMTCTDVASARIIRADGDELVYDLHGQTISLSRK